MLIISCIKWKFMLLALKTTYYFWNCFKAVCLEMGYSVSLFSDTVAWFIFFILKFIFTFVHSAALGLSCGTWDLVPWPGLEPRSPALGALDHQGSPRCRVFIIIFPTEPRTYAYFTDLCLLCGYFYMRESRKQPARTTSHGILVPFRLSFLREVLWLEVCLGKLSWLICPVSTAPPWLCYLKSCPTGLLG